MSGRKASEVSSLLNRANKARNVFDENLDNELEKFSNNIEQYQKQYTENESIILMEVSQEALKELSYEIELLNKEKEKLMKVKKRNYSSEEYKKIKKDLYFQIKKNDDQSKRIFSIIRGKSHYCDEEYRQAEVIYKNAKKIEEEKTKLEIKIKNENIRDEIIRIAKNKLGTPYLWGASGVNHFDCSSFVQYVYKKAAGVNLPRVSQEQSRFGRRINSSIKKGDLLFFETLGKGRISHVGIYIGGGQFIHASSAYRRVIISEFSGFYKERFRWAISII